MHTVTKDQRRARSNSKNKQESKLYIEQGIWMRRVEIKKLVADIK